MTVQAANSDPAPPSFADSPCGRIVLVADDLTGASDAGAAFLQAGRTVRVWFGTSVLYSVPEHVQAFTTNSRSLSSNHAARVVFQAVRALGSDPNSLFFKKVDSAARGPLAAEVHAAQRALGTRATLLAPAFPELGRTVHDGVLLIQDAGDESREVRLADLFPLSGHARSAIISKPSDIASALESGKTVLICDSNSQSDLEALASAAQEFSGLLFAGSAGLAHALASLNRVHVAHAIVPTAERILIVAGSPHPATELQLQSLDTDQPDEVRVLRIGIQFGASGRIRRAFRKFDPQVLVLTGGETALLAVHALEAHSFILQGELAPGIPWGLIQGGAAHGRIVVTKSGGFGAPTIFNEILSVLRGSE